MSASSTRERISNSSVDRAGAMLREWWSDFVPFEDLDTERQERLVETTRAFFEWRDTFRDPLKKVVTGLRSFVRSECPELHAPGSKLPVGQRLKREPQIVGKLMRYPKMKLSRMQDVGGCRAILPGGAPQVRNVMQRIERRWEVIDVHDYASLPQPTGYRAVHVVVMRDGRRIEVQLRTPGQHQWAEVVERTGLRLRMALKEGVGDPDLLEYFSLAAHGIALEESGADADKEFTDAFNTARERVRHFFRNPG